MDQDFFVLWSTKMSGWLSTHGTYTSELKQARRYNEPDAITLCSRHYESDDESYGMIPVSCQMLMDISYD